MADSQRIFDPGARFVDANGDPLAGGTLYFYQAGTSTPRTVYTDADLLTVLGTSCTLDAGGYPTTDGNTKTLIHTGLNAYKVVLKDSSGNTIATHDNIKGALDTSGFTTTYAIGTSPVVSKTAAYTILTSDKGKHFACDPTGGAFALTLPSAVSAGDGFIIYVSHNADSSYPVSVLPSGNSTVGGKSAYTVGRRESAAFVCDGANWRVISDRKPFFANLIQITDRLTAPPSSPTAGARYIINGTPTGAWSTLSFAQHDIAESDGNGSWFKWTPLDGWMAYVQDENLVTVFVDTAWTDWSNVTAPTTSALKCAVYEDFKSNGTAGGSATTGSYQTRTLNTEVKNTITGVSLASNQITLPVGTYLINFWQGFYDVAVTMSKIKVVSGTATPTSLYSYGSNHARNDTGGDSSSMAFSDVGFGVLTVTATAVIELQYYVSAASGGTNGLGIASSEPDGSGETYARVTILDLASIQGPTGAQGTQGADGLDAAYPYAWSTSTSGDPGSGKVAVNNANPTLATVLRVSETDAAGGPMADVIASWDDSTSSNKALAKISKEGATQNFYAYRITGAGTDQGTYWDFPVSFLGPASGTTLSNGNSVALLVVEKGDKGDAGATGPVGSTSFTYSTTTADADPGSGIFRLNNATPASATAAYIDNNNRGGSDVSAWLDTFDDSGNSTLRGVLYMMDAASPQTVFRIYNVSGSVTDGTGYRKLTIAHVSGAGSFTNGNEILFAFFPRGATGSGDLASTNNLSDVASAYTSFDNLTKTAEASVASATTTNIGAAASQKVQITGTTTITAFDTVTAGIMRWCRFAAALTLTHNATSLILPGGASITTAAGDSMLAISLGSGNWRVAFYQKASGKSIIAPAFSELTSQAAGLAAAPFGPFTTLASASTCDLSSVATIGVSITGTTTITSFGTGASLVRIGKFAGALTLTHNATSLILPGGANITTVAGDRFIALSDGSGNWTVVAYVRASSRPLQPDETATISKGYSLTPNNIGTVSSGTTTPDPANGNYQYYTNNGAHTLAAPSSDCAIDILVTNGASAGAITFSGFTVGSATGSALTTTNTSKFIISIRRINSVATYSVYALQ